MKLPEEGIATLQFEGDEPHTYPAAALSVQHNAILVGDDHGMRVASYPFIESEQLAPGLWSFVGATDDFTLSIKET